MNDPEVIVAFITVAGAVVVEAIRRSRAQRNTDQRLDAVLGEITPNSGKSMHDKVDRIERSVDAIQHKQTEHGERLAVVEARVADNLGRR